MKIYRSEKRRRLKAACVGNAGLVEVQVGRSIAKLSIKRAEHLSSELKRAIDLAKLQEHVMKFRIVR